MSKPADVDNMVSSFLTELSSLSDDLGRESREELPEKGNGVLVASDLQSASPKPASYRNIDILFMDDGQLTAESLAQQESHDSHIAVSHARTLGRVWAFLRLHSLSRWASFKGSIRLERLRGLRPCTDTREIECGQRRQRVR